MIKNDKANMKNINFSEDYYPFLLITSNILLRKKDWIEGTLTQHNQYFDIIYSSILRIHGEDGVMKLQKSFILIHIFFFICQQGTERYRLLLSLSRYIFFSLFKYQNGRYSDRAIIPNLFFPPRTNIRLRQSSIMIKHLRFLNIVLKLFIFYFLHSGHLIIQSIIPF